MRQTAHPPPPDNESIEELARQSYRLRQGWFNQLKHSLWPPTPSHNLGGKLEEILESTPPQSRILEVGNGGRRLRPSIVNLDIGPFAEVDAIGNGQNMPFAYNTFDAVICQGVLEHVKEPRIIVDNILAVLQPGGLVYAEIPFLQGFHADPSDYQRYTIKGIEYLFRDYVKIDSGTCVGPSSALAWMLREYFALFFGRGKAHAYASHIFGWLTFWIKYGDLLLIRNPEAHRVASGLYFLGRKTSQQESG